METAVKSISKHFHFTPTFLLIKKNYLQFKNKNIVSEIYINISLKKIFYLLCLREIDIRQIAKAKQSEK